MAAQTRQSRIISEATSKVFIKGPEEVAVHPHPACETQVGRTAVIESLSKHSRSVTQRFKPYEEGMELDVRLTTDAEGQKEVKWYAINKDKTTVTLSAPKSKIVAIMTPVLTTSFRELFKDLADDKSKNGWARLEPVSADDHPEQHRLGVAFLKEVRAFFAFDGKNPTRADRANVRIYEQDPEFAIRERYVRDSECVTLEKMVAARIEELATFNKKSTINKNRGQYRDIPSFARPPNSGDIMQNTFFLGGNNYPPKSDYYPDDYLNKILSGCDGLRDLHQLQTKFWLSFPHVYNPCSDKCYTLKQLLMISSKKYDVYWRGPFRMSRDGNFVMTDGERPNQNFFSLDNSEIVIRGFPQPEHVDATNILSLNSMAQFKKGSLAKKQKVAPVFDRTVSSSDDSRTVPSVKRPPCTDTAEPSDDSPSIPADKRARVDPGDV